ncbi:hypothetical protein [Oceanospirillum beijerinckii]|uniref:hypothetical protein n=1 Tax=Oceanospirillum beijerinckii TaxID=64976 RepID=UPI00048823A6|nr:hypothetical protein [Oceanospirillum beijerinckii]
MTEDEFALLLGAVLMVVFLVFKKIRENARIRAAARRREEEALRASALTLDELRKVSFVYQDAGGSISEREVSIDSVSSDCFTGHCYLRGEVRTFRFDRIVNEEVLILGTGEIMSSYAWEYRLISKFY